MTRCAEYVDFPAVAFAAIGGPSMKVFGDVLRQVCAVADVRGISVCGYDARADREHSLAVPLVNILVDAIAKVPVRA